MFRYLQQFLCIYKQPCVVVKQLTLDIEHYLGEAVRTKAEWGQRYMSFTDYDVQIVDVSFSIIDFCKEAYNFGF